jgi:hypothetical protein
MLADFWRFNWVPQFMLETWFMVVMAVALIALIGVLLVLRNRRPEEDD